ncbi:hypothetical protein ABZ725_37820 [Streptomyces sp. NPDC006872]|uniref:hypothetical protein n=1 Tax=Streptomyces sp. NPDC006872 TaxID=3155720 RepID=UPI0033CC2608
MPTVDPKKIKGPTIVDNSSNDRSCPWATSYPAVPGAEAATVSMKKDVEGYLASYQDTGGEQTAGCGAEDASEVPELDISFAFLVASGDVLGVRLMTQDHTETGDGLSTKTYWNDGAAHTAPSAAGLIADGSRPAFLAAVREQLKQREGSAPSRLAQLKDTDIDDVSFASDGALKVSFGRGTAGVPAAGRMTATSSRGRPSPRGCRTSANGSRTRP